MCLYGIALSSVQICILIKHLNSFHDSESLQLHLLKGLLHSEAIGGAPNPHYTFACGAAGSG
jgi:hypothetical protein